MSSPAKGSWKALLHYVVPSVSAMVLFSSYTLVDGIFVAKGVGELALASVNLALPFVNLLSGIAILLSMGTSTRCAFALGQGQRDKASALFSQTVAVIVALSLLITAAVSLFAPSLAHLLGARAQTAAYTTEYLRIVGLFSLCFILSYCLENMVKVDGAPHLSVIGVAISFAVNVGLDYLFILRLHWGVAGAAWATGLAQLASMLFFLCRFLGKKSTRRFCPFRLRLGELGRILPLGVADCSIELMLGFLTMLYNHVIPSLLGEASLATYAVIAYISLLVTMLMQGVAHGLMPLVSLCAGRGEEAVVRQHLRQGLLLTLGLGLVVELLCQLAPGALTALLLERSSPLFPQTVSALRLYALSFLLSGVSIVLAGYFAALGKAGSSVLLSLGRGFVFLPGAVLLVSALNGSVSIWLAALVGELFSLALAALLLKRNSQALGQTPAAAAA